MNYDKSFSSKPVVTIGRLLSPTGRLVACDPFFCATAAPFVGQAQPGEYDVQICRVEFPEWGPRIALARVLLRPDRPAVEFVKAHFGDPSLTTFLVDSGTACFMDEETRERFSAQLAEFYTSNPRGNYYTDVLAAEFLKSSTSSSDIGAWAMHSLAGSSHNVAMFASGLGDGIYESYWGIGDDGKPTSLVTDFRMLSQ